MFGVVCRNTVTGCVEPWTIAGPTDGSTNIVHHDTNCNYQLATALDDVYGASYLGITCGCKPLFNPATGNLTVDCATTTATGVDVNADDDIDVAHPIIAQNYDCDDAEYKNKLIKATCFNYNPQCYVCNDPVTGCPVRKPTVHISTLCVNEILGYTEGLPRRKNVSDDFTANIPFIGVCDSDEYIDTSDPLTDTFTHNACTCTTTLCNLTLDLICRHFSDANRNAYFKPLDCFNWWTINTNNNCVVSCLGVNCTDFAVVGNTANGCPNYKLSVSKNQSCLYTDGLVVGPVSINCPINMTIAKLPVTCCADDCHYNIPVINCETGVVKTMEGFCYCQADCTLHGNFVGNFNTIEYVNSLPACPKSTTYGIDVDKTITDMKLKNFVAQYMESDGVKFVPKTNLIETDLTIGSSSDVNISCVSLDYSCINGSISSTSTTELSGCATVKDFYFGNSSNCEYYKVGSGDGTGTVEVVDDCCFSRCSPLLAYDCNGNVSYASLAGPWTCNCGDAYCDCTYLLFNGDIGIWNESCTSNRDYSELYIGKRYHGGTNYVIPQIRLSNDQVHIGTAGNGNNVATAYSRTIYSYSSDMSTFACTYTSAFANSDWDIMENVSCIKISSSYILGNILHTSYGFNSSNCNYCQALFGLCGSCWTKKGIEWNTKCPAGKDVQLFNGDGCKLTTVAICSDDGHLYGCFCNRYDTTQNFTWKKYLMEGEANTSFIGTQLQWDTLSLTEKNRYDIVNIIDDTFAPITVSNCVQCGDQNPVTSDAVYSVTNGIKMKDVTLEWGTVESGCCYCKSFSEAGIPAGSCVVGVSVSKIGGQLEYDIDGKMWSDGVDCIFYKAAYSQNCAASVATVFYK